MRFLLLAIALAPLAHPVVAQQADSSNAYHDARARELVRLARERRDRFDRSITSYDATAKERLSVGLRTRLRDRLVYRRETATRIDWRRGGPINITALGAREVAPVFSPAAWVPGDLDFLPDLVFDPMDPEGLIRIDTTVLRHPLSAGAEAHYRYRTGDTTTIDVPEKRIRLIELRVEPRRRDVQLISGSFLIDEATHAVVQVVFRLAKDYEIEFWRGNGQVTAADRTQLRALQEDTSQGRNRGQLRRVPLPGFMKPMRAELQYVTIEYGLIQLRWWLPRLIAAEGMVQLGSIRTPLHYERSYSYDRVVGDTAVALIARSEIALDTATPGITRPCRARAARGVTVVVDGDSAWSERYRKQQEERHQRMRAYNDSLIAKGDTVRERRRAQAEECGSLYHVSIRDSAQLINSTDLPASIYSQDELTSEAELSKITQQIKRLSRVPWLLQRPRLSWGFGGNGLLRYN